MPKIKRADSAWESNYGPGHEEYYFDCPGCGQMHRAIVRWGATAGRTQPTWTFNGSLERPTFNPSFLHGQGKAVCHYYIREGEIQFLADCTHAHAGKTVTLPELA